MINFYRDEQGVSVVELAIVIFTAIELGLLIP